MLENIFDFLAKLKAGLTKPDPRITVEVYDMGNGDGLRFQFIWYDDPLPPNYSKVNVFIPKDMIEHVRNEDFLSDYIIRFVNVELERIIK